MMVYVAVAVYAASLVLANLLVVVFGPSVTALNAFLLIGLDLALRDWLHFRLRPLQMLSLIAGTGVLTYAINPAAGTIAVASAAAFSAAALADWVVFTKVRGSWMLRSNSSNVAGAAVDSMVFPTIAFGALLPQIVLAQFTAKVLGGLIWSALLSRGLEKERRCRR